MYRAAHSVSGRGGSTEAATRSVLSIRGLLAGMAIRRRAGRSRSRGPVGEKEWLLLISLAEPVPFVAYGERAVLVCRNLNILHVVGPRHIRDEVRSWIPFRAGRVVEVDCPNVGPGRQCMEVRPDLGIPA